MDQPHLLDVVIIGAGPAGIGCAIALLQCGVENLLILERDSIGSSFKKWPRQMRLITPSFYSNPFAQPDLNAITPDTSPADLLQREHPSGADYALYLQACVEHYNVPVQTGIDVHSLTPQPDGTWIVHNNTSNNTSTAPLHTRFVIWAIGEFSTPDAGGIRGSEYCRHNSQVKDWGKLTGQSFTIIGGYESGIDAAIHLAWQGRHVRVMSRGEPWSIEDPDPSRSLSPYTRERLRTALEDAPGSIHFYKNAHIVEVQPQGSSWLLKNQQGNTYTSPTAPILCTGFTSALAPVQHLFATDEEHGQTLFSEESDESTLHPGLFYSGPSLSHRQSLFCFIYKFRSRFGIIARSIATRLGLPWEEPLQRWRERGFMIDDLTCCTDCECAVPGQPDELAEVHDLELEPEPHLELTTQTQP